MAKLLQKTTEASEYEVAPFTQAERTGLLAAARVDEKSMIQSGWLPACAQAN
jgi:hypothetical protein